MRNYLTILLFLSNPLASKLELLFLTVNETTQNYLLGFVGFFYQMTVFGTTAYR